MRMNHIRKGKEKKGKKFNKGRLEGGEGREYLILLMLIQKPSISLLILSM
jgi:hypothetical protein